MEIHIPTTNEIHMIAYLTLHGWELSFDERQWKKSGFNHEVMNYRIDQMVESDEFNLEDAYWAEKEAQEKQTPP